VPGRACSPSRRRARSKRGDSVRPDPLLYSGDGMGMRRVGVRLSSGSPLSGLLAGSILIRSASDVCVAAPSSEPHQTVVIHAVDLPTAYTGTMCGASPRLRPVSFHRVTGRKPVPIPLYFRSHTLIATRPAQRRAAPLLQQHAHPAAPTSRHESFDCEPCCRGRGRCPEPVRRFERVRYFSPR